MQVGLEPGYPYYPKSQPMPESSQGLAMIFVPSDDTTQLGPMILGWADLAY